MSLKYVILKKTGFLVPVIFDGDILSHKDAAPAGYDIISAGFCRIADGVVGVWGASGSLDIDSRPGDQEIIRRAIAGERPLTMREAGFHP
jgi:hypothetical protein